MPNRSVGIIGGGFVGGAVANFFPDALVYDKFKKSDSWDEVCSQEVLFICVPTPYNNGFDRSVLDEVFEKIANEAKEKIVVLKSTAVPGTTAFFQKKYPHLKILFNPEFLTQATAQEDFISPDKQIVGFTEQSKAIAREILGMLPKAPYQNIMEATAAELVKYAVNSYYANKVIFANMIYDVAEALGVDYQTWKEAFVSDKRITDSHFDVMHGGYRGYGGKCLPKDTRSLIELGSAHGVDMRLLEAVDAINERLQNMSSVDSSSP